MEVRILGSMEVLAGARRVDLPSGRARSLLALLTLHAGQQVAAERLVDELWGGVPPPTATTVVHGLVSRLRKALESERAKEVLQTAGPAYLLAIDPDGVDANRFKRLLDEARGGAPHDRAPKLTAALGLWRGPALADFTYEPFAQRAIAALEDARLEAIEARFEAELALGRDAQFVAELREAVAAYPFRERLRGFLMIALYRAGRQAEALEACRDTRAVFLEELGLEPGPALRQLETAILRQDPVLELRPAARPRDETASWLPRERRTVTVAVVDVAPAADPGLDAEAAAGLGARAVRVASEALERHGARVERSLGDELIAVFGFPVAHEDDALRAVRATLDVRTAVHALDGAEGSPNRSRAGVETGDIVVAGPGGALRDAVSGPVVAAARRLGHAASDGEVVVGPGAQRLLRGAVIFAPVDAASGVVAWRVLEVVAHAAPIPREMDAPMVGRQDELSRLRAAFRRAVRSKGPARATVVGDAGIGKSRLAKEVVASLGEAAHAIVLRCSPPEDAMGFFPVRQAVVEAAGVHGWRRLHELLETADGGMSAVEEIGNAIALRSPPVTAGEMAGPMRRLLATLSGEHPLVVVLDDLHWADTSFLDLVDGLERDAIGRVLLLCLARPDLYDDRAPSRDDTVTLEPLAASELARLVIDRRGAIAQGSLHRIVELSQGNPLFAEQLLAALDEGDVDAVPASLAGLLSMRLDGLGPAERDVLRCASIAGLDLDVDVVSALLPDGARTFLDRHLETLERKRLIQRTGPGRFRFAHALIQMVAYQSMTREDRARLHETFADHMEQQGSDPLATITGRDGLHPGG